MICPKCSCTWSLVLRPVDYADDSSPYIAECTLCNWRGEPIAATDRDEAVARMEKLHG